MNTTNDGVPSILRNGLLWHVEVLSYFFVFLFNEGGRFHSAICHTVFRSYVHDCNYLGFLVPKSPI